MSPVTINALATLALLTLAGGLFGSTGTYYLVTTAGLPHFILAFVFAAISARHGRPGRRRILAILAALSVVACAFYVRFPIADLVGAYFVVHMFRDEVFMYVSRRARFDPASLATLGDGDAVPSTRPELARAWLAGRLLIVIALTAFATGRLAVAARGRAGGGLFTDPAAHLTGSTVLDLTVVGGLVLLIALISAAPRGVWRRLQLPGEAREFLVLFVVVVFAAYLREATLFLALFHYVSWYLFYGDKLQARQRSVSAPEATTGFWRRAMTRPASFATLMIAANLIAVLGLIAYLRFPGTLGFLSGGYEYAYFPYWTIPHVTLSFLPRR